MHTEEEGATILNGFFVIDGKILENRKESESFEDLELDPESEIVLVTWCDFQKIGDDYYYDDTWEQLYEYWTKNEYREHKIKYIN